MATKVISAKSPKQLDAAARAGARIIRAGGLVGFATETVYGIAALATDARAVERIRRLKSRPTRPFTVHLSGARDMGRYVRDMPFRAQQLIAKAWPGPVTVLLPTGGKLATEEFNSPGVYKTLCYRNVIGLRCPQGELCEKMLSSTTGPVIAPSANPAGLRPPTTVGDVLKYLQGQIDLLIDSGPTIYKTSSTIVKFDSRGMQIVRPGPFGRDKINRLASLNIMFVCTGNTCRSPIAVGLAKKMLARSLSCRTSSLGAKGYAVYSSGVTAAPDQPPTNLSLNVACEMGADITDHRSQKLTVELINSSDLIFCMTDVHAGEVVRLVPTARNKVMRLDPGGNIADPLGGDRDVYRSVAQRIKCALEARLREII